MNILLRGLTLLSKFAFILFLGKYSIDETNLGVFGLFTTTIALLIYLLGFDFYVFNTREIIYNRKQIYHKITNQLLFHILAYLLVIPLAIWFVFSLDMLSSEFLYVFVILILSEHLGQELYRLYTTVEKPFTANLMLFLRSGLWIWIAFSDFFLLDNQVDLRRYLWYWGITSWITFIVFLFAFIRETNLPRLKWKFPDWKFIIRGIRTAGLFFISSVSFQIIQFSDRYMIDYFHGKKELGVYTAYSQFANAIDVFTFSAVTMIYYPKLVKDSSDRNRYRKVKKDYWIKANVLTIILIITIVVTAPYFLRLMDKASFLVQINAMYILLASSFFLTLSNVYHYDLYVKKKDRIIVYISLVAMLINVGLNLALIPKFALIGAAWGTFIAFFIMFILKERISSKIPLHGNI